MAFQSTVRAQQAFGVVGELHVDGPVRAQSYQIDPTATAANCVVGRVFTLDTATNMVKPGGTVSDTVVFAGVLAAPKEYATNGTAAGGSLAPTLLVLPGTVADFVSMGVINVSPTTACKAGDKAYYTTATGEINTTVASGTAPGGSAVFPGTGGVIDYVIGAGANTIAPLRLTV